MSGINKKKIKNGMSYELNGWKYISIYGKPKETQHQTIESKNFTITLNLDNDNLSR